MFPGGKFLSGPFSEISPCMWFFLSSRNMIVCQPHQGGKVRRQQNQLHCPQCPPDPQNATTGLTKLLLTVLAHSCKERCVQRGVQIGPCLPCLVLVMLQATQKPSPSSGTHRPPRNLTVPSGHPAPWEPHPIWAPLPPGDIAALLGIPVLPGSQTSLVYPQPSWRYQFYVWAPQPSWGPQRFL